MTTQISAYISNETKMILEKFSAKTGQKKGFILEQALLHYINAHQELPADIIIPPSISVSKDVFDNVIMADREPTPALRDLLHEDRD